MDLLLDIFAARDRPPAVVQTLHREVVVPASPDAVFAFFAEAANLERLTPPWINFRIRTPLPIAMREGAVIDYSIKLYGLPIPWRTRIDVWEPALRFVDRQIAGPYLWWRHEHRFEAAGAGTRVIDDVEFVPRAAAITARRVAHDVQRIFDYRHLVLMTLFEPPDRAAMVATKRDDRHAT